ncbi:MAG: hypothetical protein ACI9MC_002137 [Kiritimatiellia bacterium]|jgi:hypothetical protein
MTKRWITAGLAVSIVLGCAGAGRTKSDLQRSLKKGEIPVVHDPASLTQQDLQHMVDFLVPHIEAVSGRTFKSVPPARLGTHDALAAVLGDESLDIVRAIYDAPDPVLERLAARSSSGVPSILGKYAVKDGSVYVATDKLPALSAASNLPADRSIEPVIIVLTHELAHALQDQVAELHDIEMRLEDLDHFDGFRGITEGQANWITLRVAERLKLEEAFWALSKGQGWGKDGLQTPGAFPVWTFYGQGMAMCEHHFAEGGNDRLWTLVAHPPRSTTMIFRPETYAASLTAPRDYAAVLRGIDDKLAPRVERVAINTHLGEAPLRKETLGLDPERVERVLSEIQWGHAIQFEPTVGSPWTAGVQVIDFKEAAAAKELVNLLADGLDAQAKARTDLEKEMAEKVPGLVPQQWSVEATSYGRIEADVALRRVVGPVAEIGADGQPVRSVSSEQQSLWIVRGERLVVVEAKGYRPGLRLDKTVEEIFRRLKVDESE